MHAYLPEIVVGVVMLAIGVAAQINVKRKFGRGLASRMFGTILPMIGFVGIGAFIIGRTGGSITAILIAVPVGAILIIGTLQLLYRMTVIELTGYSEELVTSISQLSATAKQSAAAANEQATAVSEVGTTIEEIRRTSQAAASNAEGVVEVAEESAATGQQGREMVDEAVHFMSLIIDKATEAMRIISELRKQSAQIGEIVVSVNELTEQSNLLAVNASIEASRAGEHGRGFSAVATEVRSLAEQSKRSNKTIQGILDQIQASSEDAVRATRECQECADDGRHSVDKVRSVIGNLASVLEESSDMARQIAGASNQQAAGIKQISEAMISVSKRGEDTASVAEQLEQAVYNLSSLGDQIRKMISEKGVSRAANA